MSGGAVSSRAVLAAAPGGAVLYQLREVTKRRSLGAGFVLQVPELAIRAGEMVALVGDSGCGKSTLLDLLAMVLRPDGAEVFTFLPAAGARLDVWRAWQGNDQNRLARVRGANLGYVLQTGGLLPFLSVRDNIALSRRLLGLPRQGWTEALAKRLGIANHLSKLPGQLSVGERQRVAIARALAHQPAVVLADEPTASLAPIRARQIMDLFATLVSQYGATLVLATHDRQAVEHGGFRVVNFVLSQAPRDGSVLARVEG